MEADREGELEREEEKDSSSRKSILDMLAVAETVRWCCCCCCVGCGRRGGSRGLTPLRARFFLAARGTEGSDGGGWGGGERGGCECEETEAHRRVSLRHRHAASTRRT